MMFGLAPLLLLAAEPGSGDQAGITVIGEKPTEEQVRAAASEYLRKTGISVGESQVARWQAKVCPKVFGLPDARAVALVLEKFRAIAEAARVPLATRSCRSNIAIIFTDNGAALAKRMAQRDPGRFSEVPLQRKDELITGAAPMRWWYQTRIANRDGSPVAAVLPPWTSGNSEAGGPVIPAGQDSTVLQATGSSIVGSSSVRQIMGATVIIDVERAQGKTLEAVSAMAAFVGLAEIRGARSPRDSILGLFADDATINGLSAWDAAFLKALYSMPLDRNARSQRGKIVSAMIANDDKP